MSERPEEADPPRPRLTAAEAETVLAQTAGAALAGAPLADALEAASSEAAGRAARRTLHDLSKRIRSGESLDTALAAAAPELPPYVAELVRMAARDDRRGDLLTEFVNTQREERLLRREIQGALAYPLFLLLFTFVLAVLLPTGMASDFYDLHRELQIPVPPSLRLNQWVAEWGTTFLLGTAAAIGAVALALRISYGAGGFRTLLHDLPLVGSIGRNLALARWARAMSLLLEGSMPLAEALRVTSIGLGDVKVGRSVAQAAGRVEAGETLSNALGAYELWPEGVVAFIRYGEQQRLLPEALESVAQLCDERARQRGRWFRLTFPSVVFVLIAHVVLFSYLQLTRPIIELISKLS